MPLMNSIHRRLLTHPAVHDLELALCERAGLVKGDALDLHGGQSLIAFSMSSDLILSALEVGPRPLSCHSLLD